jgi:hypothetical protein
MALITIENRGQKIKDTNYWTSDYAKSGKIFLSVNAGCIRMLIPESMFTIIPEIETGKKVIISRGPWPDMGKEDAFELMFEDYSDNPFALWVGTEQWDLIPKKSQKWDFSAWTQTGMFYSAKCKYRTVTKLPWLKELS